MCKITCCKQKTISCLSHIQCVISLLVCLLGIAIAYVGIEFSKRNNFLHSIEIKQFEPIVSGLGDLEMSNIQVIFAAIVIYMGALAIIQAFFVCCTKMCMNKCCSCISIFISFISSVILLIIGAVIIFVVA